MNISIGELIHAKEGTSYVSLQRDDVVWIVEKGPIDIYFERKGKNEELPIFLIHRQEGEIVFPFRVSLDNVLIQAYLDASTALRQISIQDWESIVQNDANVRTKLIRDISSWVIELNESIIHIPKKEISSYFYLGEEKTFSPQVSMEIAPYFEHTKKDQLIWVKVTQGNLYFLGEKSFLMPLEGIFPLCYINWMSITEKGSLVTYETSKIVEEQSWIQGLTIFHHFIVQYLIYSYEEKEKQEEKRIKESKNRRRKILDAAFQRLIDVFEKRTFPYVERHLPMIGQCCQIIGKYSGFLFAIPKDLFQGKNDYSALMHICENSHVRYRQVRLVGKWWKQDNGHLLAWDQEGSPLALIRKGGSYYSVEPKTLREIKMNSHTVSALQKDAYMFYLPLEGDITEKKNLRKSVFKNHRKDILTIIALGFGSIVCALFVPLANGIIFNYIIPLAQGSLIHQLVVGLLVFGISASLFSFISSYAVLHLQTLVHNKLQGGLWDRLLKLPVSFFHRFTIGDLVRRVFSIWQIQNILSSSFFNVLFTGVFSLLYLVMMFYYSWPLTLLGIMVLFLGILINIFCIRWKVKIDSMILQEQGLFNGFIVQVISGIEKIRLKAAEHIIFSKWGKQYTRIQSYNILSLHIANFMQAFNQMMPILGTFSIFSLGVYLVKNVVEFQIGNFIAFNAAFGSFSIAMYNAFSIAIQTFGNVIPRWKMSKVIFTSPEEILKDQVSPGTLQGLVEIDNVFFHYEENLSDILRGISLVARPGEFIAIVGPSGCGKSTLVRLLLKFNEPSSGCIYYDGKDVSDLDIKKVRQQLGVVLQDSEILAGTIYDNLICGGIFSQEEVTRAMQLTGFDVTMQDFPMGVHTYLTDSGKNLSGGQKQQLLITRALLGNPKILIFDEATNALDSKSQAIVSENIEHLKITRIVIAHRISTIKNADRIYFLDHGKIEAFGTFEELVQQHKPFAAWVAQQR
ncbi:MAG: ATP-binding cassette domain-containing protein [Parachlamydiales bacterium]|nr:ATP-binding cassette domain-containing protein [Parachlamydiales bacterium]